MTDFVPTPAELQLAQMVSGRHQREAAKHDPVLVNRTTQLNRCAMTPDQLNDTLDAMAAAAADE